jgi:hypothetical protein
MFVVPSSAGGGAMVTGAGGRHPRAECGLFLYVMEAPSFDDDLGILKAVEDLAVQEFVLELAI